MAPRILTRADAGLASPRKRIPAAPPLRRELFVHHTVTRVTDDPAADWRHVQDVAFGRRMADVAYTFGIHPDGTCLHGREAGVEGAHTAGHNRSGHAIVLIGNYDEDEPSAAMIESFRYLRQRMGEWGLLTPDHTLQPHQAVYATACPGRHTIARLDALALPYTPQEAIVAFNLIDVAMAHSLPPDGKGRIPFWGVNAAGAVFAFNGAPYLGGLPDVDPTPRTDVVAIEAHGAGYVIVRDDGHQDESGWVASTYAFGG